MATRVDEVRSGNGGPSGSYAGLDDRMLVLDFQTGNGSRDPAFAEIHRRYSSLARHICFRILANANDAEDATQETMIRVLQGLGRFNGRYQLQPWVARIATNVSLDVLRARSRRPHSADRELIDLDGEPDDAAEPSVLVEQLLERERVQQVLAELPGHHREALVLREYEGRSHAEIGRALGVTPSQAKALIHRAKRSFRRAWDRKEERSRGLAALGPLFLTPLRASEWLRRLFGSATEAAAATSASPVAATTAISAGERVTAAAVVIVMAATVGVGAVGLRHRADGRADRQQAPVVAPSPAAPVVAPSPAAPVVAPPVRPEKPESSRAAKPEHAKRVKTTDPPVAGVAPAVSPGPTLSPSPSVSETPAPTPTPEATTMPTPGPPPAWSFGIQSWGAWSLACDCARAFQLVSSQVEGDVDEGAFFQEEVVGHAVQADGTQAWDVSAKYSGSAGAGEGRFSLFLTVQMPNGVLHYEGWAVAANVQQTAGGGAEYSYVGHYRLVSFHAVEGDEVDLDSLPRTGVLTARAAWWSDGVSLTGVGLVLEER